MTQTCVADHILMPSQKARHINNDLAEVWFTNHYFTFQPVMYSDSTIRWQPFTPPSTFSSTTMSGGQERRGAKDPAQDALYPNKQTKCSQNRSLSRRRLLQFGPKGPLLYNQKDCINESPSFRPVLPVDRSILSPQSNRSPCWKCFPTYSDGVPDINWSDISPPLHYFLWHLSHVVK